MTISDTTRRRPVITLLVVCQSSIGLIFGGIGLFLPLIRTDLGISFTEAGTLAAVSNLTYALMQVPSGYLADRFPPRRLFLIGMLGLNLLSALFAVLESYPLLLIDQALAGVFRALVFMPGLLLMTELFPPGRRASAMGLYVVGGFSSNILLSAIGPALVGPLGWRLLFVLFAGFGLLSVALYRYLAGPSGRREPSGAPVRFGELPGLLRQRIVQLTAVIQFTRLSVAQGFTFWLPSYLVVDRGQSLAAAGLVAALASAISAPVNYLGGYLSDRINRPLLVIGGSLVVLTGGLTLLTYVPGMLGVLGVVALISVAIQVYFGPLFALPLQVLGDRNAGLISGIGNFWANLGGFAFVYALGAVKDTTGSFRAGFLSLAVLCVVALIATWVARPSLRRAG
ncbi:MFS transporter [Actinoplanes derwentensis]|uniref:Nitrate/nitrite transporter NarK n=1 Tax=Actinoplanes derwentensis TaxID=113562 RepID=A0A1H2BHS3_9ACTN|nr:MFS transporter [Actinoplanes derwentensis]GID87823.1 MFS transporter [Actinoplanes derwentensis]SDT57694.1 Nitrate/nitrite transporter NarK [Actinoplanes derwentensis]